MFSSFFNFPLQRQTSGTAPPRNFAVALKAFPGSISQKEEIETGNKVLLPSSVLHKLSQYRIPNPLIFCIQNTMLGNSTNVGVLEFTAEEGTCIVPSWMFDVLNLDFGLEVILMLVPSVPRGKFVKIQPHETAFIDLPDPRTVLEKNLARYTCLTKGETINIKIADRNFLLNILEIEPNNPNNCICVIEADVEVDFAPPLDYKEPEPNLVKTQSSLNLNDEEEEEEKGPFHGKGIKLNGQVVKDDPSQRKKVSNDEYDPRKHRLPNGVRQTIIQDDFKNLKSGFKIGQTNIQKVTGTTGPTKQMSPVPLLKKNSSTISGTTGHHPHLKADNSPLKITNITSNKLPTAITGSQNISKSTTAPTTADTNISQSKPSYTGGMTSNTNTSALKNTTTTPSTSYTGLGVGNKYSTQPTASQSTATRPTGVGSTTANSSSTTTSTTKPSTNTTPSYTKPSTKK